MGKFIKSKKASVKGLFTVKKILNKGANDVSHKPPYLKGY